MYAIIITIIIITVYCYSRFAFSRRRITSYYTRVNPPGVFDTGRLTAPMCMSSGGGGRSLADWIFRFGAQKEILNMPFARVRKYSTLVPNLGGTTFLKHQAEAICNLKIETIVFLSGMRKKL